MIKEMFQNLYAYRQLLKSNVQKEIRGKYKGSFLGVLWSFVNPLLMTLVYAIVFPFILKSTEPHYLTYLVIGILPWNYFTTVIGQGTTTILLNGGILKKVYFPREILPISVNLSGAVNFLISCIVMCLFLIFSGIGFSWHILFFPLIMIIQFLIQQAIIFITGAINVYVRDAEYIINFFINMLFYATPILYSKDLFAGTVVEWVIKLNPVAILINSYRDIFYYQTIPDIPLLLILLTISVICLYLGLRVFRKLEKGFAEEL
ncbi:MAG: ABC transporter permease [Firmicutes bacterium]|nr:ABC transporter permease [Bacillota bacterium]